ncbi:MAG TPA: WYL domain-containing protein [Pirellulales bacterium]|jgi:proteasome accessory factor B|nr:WYL domain-containing protein [Pirellulales bacterium]
MNLTRIQRLLKLIGLLQVGRGHNIRSLANDCEVSRRTIFRDLDVLRAAGVPLEFDDEFQSYRLPQTYLLPPTNFSAEEALAVLVLCDELGANHRLPFYAPARSAAMKLHAALPARLQKYLRDITGAIRIQLPPGAAIDDKQPIYQQLIDALARRQCVRIRYDSFSDGQVISTRLSPYRLMFSLRSWYVIGRSSLHRATRTFHVGRILKLEPTGDAYRIQRGFSLEQYLRNAWHLIPEPGPDRQVRIRFEKLVARNVAEVRWHATQQTEFQPDGSLDFRVTVSGLKEISWWVLGYGDKAEVLEPPELRAMVAAHAGRMAEQYAE